MKSIIRKLKKKIKYENIGNTSDFIKTMLKQTNEDDLKGLNLQSILIKPVQRITKYSLFIDQLIKVLF